MKRFIPLGIGAIIIALAIALQKPAEPAVNPDPNHTHADFAVWVDGEKLDFSGPEFMSEVYKEGQEVRTNPMRKYLHLHDGIGHVIHRHKPLLSLREFFRSIGFTTGTVHCEDKLDTYCWEELSHVSMGIANARIYVYLDSIEHLPEALGYIFEDGDNILITTSTDPAEVTAQFTELTDDACMFSKTCPERGDPPAENCIADPAVPCVIPE